MRLTLSLADFSGTGKNIGTLNSWFISKNTPSGLTWTTAPSSVDKGTDFNAVAEIDTANYELVTISVTMGTTTQTGVGTSGGITISNSGSQYTIYISSVTANVNISVTTKNLSTGVPDSGGSGGSTPGGNTPSGGTLITSGTLAGSYLYENHQFEGASAGEWTGLKQDANNAYFVYDKIPVTPGYTINAPKGRAFYFSKSDGSVISGGTQNNFSKINYTTTIPSNAAFITICYKYADIQPSAVNVTITGGFGSPVTTLLKDSGATYMAETAIESGKTEPSSYSNFYTYHLIPVTGGNKYKLENCRLSIWYDSNKQFISQVNFNVNSSTATTTDWSHVAPNNAAYLSVCVKVGDIDKDSVAMVEYPKL